MLSSSPCQLLFQDTVRISPVEVVGNRLQLHVKSQALLYLLLCFFEPFRPTQPKPTFFDGNDWNTANVTLLLALPVQRHPALYHRNISWGYTGSYTNTGIVHPWLRWPAHFAPPLYSGYSCCISKCTISNRCTMLNCFRRQGISSYNCMIWTGEFPCTGHDNLMLYSTVGGSIKGDESPTAVFDNRWCCVS